MSGFNDTHNVEPACEECGRLKQHIKWLLEQTPWVTHRDRCWDCGGKVGEKHTPECPLGRAMASVGLTDDIVFQDARECDEEAPAWAECERLRGELKECNRQLEDQGNVGLSVEGQLHAAHEKIAKLESDADAFARVLVNVTRERDRLRLELHEARVKLQQVSE